MNWAIITGEYPPQKGGVSDYSCLLANALAEAGDKVHVFAPEVLAPSPHHSGVHVQRLAGHFSARALGQLDAELKQISPPPTLLVQYVPHAFGMKAMNLPFCLWLWRRRNQRIWVMFHEVLCRFRRGQGLRRHVLAAMTWLMAALVARSAERLFVSIPAWQDLLRRVAPHQPQATWLPVFSNLQDGPNPEPVRLRRYIAADRTAILLGHFGTCGGEIGSCLEVVVPMLLAADARRRFLFIGADGSSLAGKLQIQYPELQMRIISSGTLTAGAARDWIAACDLLIQPYPDGISSRRGSAMAGLALQVPVLTNCGSLSEPLWRGSGAVALADDCAPTAFVRFTEKLLGEPDRLGELAVRGRHLYDEKFELSKVVARMRSAAGLSAPSPNQSQPTNSPEETSLC